MKTIAILLAAIYLIGVVFFIVFPIQLMMSSGESHDPITVVDWFKIVGIAASWPLWLAYILLRG